MNWSVKGIRAVKMLIRNKLLLLFLCFVFVFYLLNTSSDGKLERVRRKRRKHEVVPSERHFHQVNALNEKDMKMLQQKQHEGIQHGTTSPREQHNKNVPAKHNVLKRKYVNNPRHRFQNWTNSKGKLKKHHWNKRNRKSQVANIRDAMPSYAKRTADWSENIFVDRKHGARRTIPENKGRKASFAQKNVIKSSNDFVANVTIRARKSRYHIKLPLKLYSNNNSEIRKSKHFNSVGKGLRNSTYTKGGPSVDLFNFWRDSMEFHCKSESEMEAFPNFMRIKNIVINRRKGTAPPGGENVTEVLRQKEATEFVKIKPGFYEVSCQDPAPLQFWGNHHMQNWFINLANTHGIQPRAVDLTIDSFTLAVVRIEYANLYHLIQDLYGAFLMMEFYGKSQAETNIILVEAHPLTSLDLVWQKFFNSTKRLSALPMRTHFKELVWCIGGHDNPMSDFISKDLPLVQEFLDLVLRTYHIPRNSHVLNCDRVAILLLWRHDYIAHARNPSGVIKRKFANEQEILQTIKINFPNVTVKAVRIELFSMEDQLKMVTETDILFGMLGAGLTHSMFLPNTSGLIELRPKYYTETSRHFESITRWRRLKYIRWTNQEENNEVRQFETKIPSRVVVSTISDMMKLICPS